MSYLFNAAYVLLLFLVSPWLIASAIRKGKYREGWGAKLLGRVPRRSSNRPCVWYHAVSVGEVNLLEPLLRQFTRRWPNWDCVISTTTMTGYALAKKKYPSLSVFYCPLDFSWSVSAAMRRVRPDVLVLAELELWPNLIRAAKRRGARVAVVNGRLSEHSFRGYRRAGPLIAWLLRKIDVIAVQNDEYAGRFRQLGANASSLHVTGSLKFDGAETDRANPRTRRLAALAGIAPDDIVFLAGSTQAPEEQLALDTFLELQQAYSKLRLILVPRHPERFNDVAALLDSRQIGWQRRTELSDESPASSARVLLVDTIGELGAWWGTAHIAFVGGSLGDRGGQNMIEPAAYGAGVCFGPNTKNFRDIVAMMLAGDAAVVVHDHDEFTGFVHNCLAKPRFTQRLSANARHLVTQHLGATRRTVDLLAPWFDVSHKSGEKAA